MLIILADAVKLFGFEMCFYRNKNCLFKLLFSIWSGSVTTILPDLPEPRLTIAKFLSNSQPIAPAPTINMRD